MQLIDGLGVVPLQLNVTPRLARSVSPLDRINFDQGMSSQEPFPWTRSISNRGVENSGTIGSFACHDSLPGCQCDINMQRWLHTVSRFYGTQFNTHKLMVKTNRNTLLAAARGLTQV
jgi:hypothetical protein